MAINLGTINDLRRSDGLAGNDADQILGVSSDGLLLPFNAFIWDEGVTTDLGALDGDGFEVVAWDINERGTAVGQSDNLPFMWEDGVMTELERLEGATSERAVNINDAGQIVGTTLIGEQRRVVVWDGGTVVDVGSLGDGDTELSGPLVTSRFLSEAGHVVGTSETAEGEMHAFIWKDGRMTDIGSGLGGTSSRAFGVNVHGDAVGTWCCSDGRRGLIRRGGEIIDLGPGVIPVAINDRGQVAGTLQRSSTVFVWENGTLTDLGVVADPVDINEAGQIAATAGDAVIIDQGQVTRLGALGGEGSSAFAITEVGHVIGSAQTADEHWRATLWRPLSPVEQLVQISVAVTDLETAGTINGGQANSLTNKLNVATAMLNDGKETPAVNQLEASVNQVQALIEGGVLTPEEGQPLIDAAQAVIDNITVA